MRTLRLSLVGTVILMLLGSLGLATVAQSEEGRATWVTLVSEQCELAEDDAHTSGSEEGMAWVRDFKLACTVAYSDPRVSGDRETLYHEDCFSEFPCVYWGTQELVGPDGTWMGWYNGTVDADRSATGYGVLAGSGGYEGLTFVWHASGPYDAQSSGYGIVYQGDAPPSMFRTGPFSFSRSPAATEHRGTHGVWTSSLARSRASPRRTSTHP